MSTRIWEVVLPQLGANDETATILEWLVSSGEKVLSGTVLATLETTKATVELEAEENGFIYPLAEPGESHAVQDVIALILSRPDEEAARKHMQGIVSEDEELEENLPREVQLTNKAQKLANELRVDLHRLPSGRILRERDIRSFVNENSQHYAASHSGNQWRRVAIYGASQGGSVVRECVLAMGGYEIVAYLDDTPGLIGGRLDGIPIRSGKDLENLLDDGVGSVVSHVASRSFRLQLRDRVNAAGLHLLNVIHPSVVVSASLRMGQGNLIKAGAVLGTEVSIGDCCIIDNGVVVPHHNRLGHAVHLAPGVSMGGDCRVGDRTLLGVGASIAPRITIGADVIVAPASGVVRDVPDFAVMEGNPARQIGENRSVRGAQN